MWEWGCAVNPGYPTGIWGKLRQDKLRKVIGWLPLRDHCADVAVAVRVLTDIKSIRQSLALLMGLKDLTPVQRDRIAVFAFMHDCGKANLGFADRGHEVHKFQVKFHHNDELAWAIHPQAPDWIRQPLKRALRLRDVFGWVIRDPLDGSLIEALVNVIIFHHGFPIHLEGNPPSWLKAIWRCEGNLDPIAEVAFLMQEAEKLFPLAFTSTDPADLLPLNSKTLHHIEGLIIQGDWIASGLLAWVEGVGPERDAATYQKCREVLHDMGFDLSKWPLQVSADTLSLAPLLGVAHLRPMQAAVEKICLDFTSILVEDETGSGKTEMALLYYFRLFAAGKVDGLYFALPTRTSAAQIYGRVLKFIKQMFGDHHPPVTLAVPGYEPPDDGFIRDNQDEGDGNDSEGNPIRHWAARSSKCFLMGSIIVGTIDQVLMSSLMVNHAHLRAAALSRLLLVVDEVHDSDTYMKTLLQHVLDRHHAAGGRSVLMSATVAAATRQLIFKLPPEDWAVARSKTYPLITPMGGSPIPVHQRGESKKIQVKVLPFDATTIAHIAATHASRGAKVLVLSNTVRDAIWIQQMLEKEAKSWLGIPHLFSCAGVLMPHHSRFSRIARRHLDDALIKAFGPGERTPGGMVVSATQTIQQSLDIDFDVILTMACPIDIFLQRVGRGHRHDRIRPLGYETLLVYFIVPEGGASLVGQKNKLRIMSDGKHGWGTVYNNALVEAARKVLENHACINIPDDNRILVEDAQHPEALLDLSRRDPKNTGEWVKELSSLRVSNYQDKDEGEQSVIDWKEHYGARNFPKDPDHPIRSRLSGADVDVKFDPPMIGPLGETVLKFSLPFHMLPKSTLWTKPERVVQGSGGFRFQLANMSYRYDRFGLRKGV